MAERRNGMQSIILERQGTHFSFSANSFTELTSSDAISGFCLDFCKVIDFELPNTVQLKVVDVDPGLRGDTAQGNKYCCIGLL